jgi:hypothetical protein
MGNWNNGYVEKQDYWEVANKLGYNKPGTCLHPLHYWIVSESMHELMIFSISKESNSPNLMVFYLWSYGPIDN